MSAPGIPSPQEVAEMARLRSFVGNGPLGVAPAAPAAMPMAHQPYPMPQPMAPQMVQPALMPPPMPMTPPMPAGLAQAQMYDEGYYPELYGQSAPAGYGGGYGSGGYGGGGYGGGYGAEVAPPAYGSYGGGYATDQDKDAMRRILESFHSAEGDEPPAPQRSPQAQRPQRPVVVEDEWDEPPRRQRPVAERSEPAPRKPTTWKAQPSESKTFDVVHPSGDALIRNLHLQETATTLAKLLNRGLYLNHASVRRVIELDEEFGTKRKEALGYKAQVKKLVQEGDQRAAKILEKTFTKAKSDALTVKAKLVKLSESV